MENLTDIKLTNDSSIKGIHYTHKTRFNSYNYVKYYMNTSETIVSFFEKIPTKNLLFAEAEEYGEDE